MFRFEATTARVGRAIAEIVNKESGHNGRKNRVYDLGRGFLAQGRRTLAVEIWIMGRLRSLNHSGMVRLMV